MLLLLGDQQGQPPASIGCEAQRQPTTNCTFTCIHVQAVSQRKPHLMSGLQRGRVFNMMEAINIAFPAVQDYYVVLRGKSALSSWSCNNITECMLCDMANYPLFPPLNTILFIHARKHLKFGKLTGILRWVNKLETEKHFSFSYSLSVQPALNFPLLHCVLSLPVTSLQDVYHGLTSSPFDFSVLIFFPFSFLLFSYINPNA